MLLPDVSRDGCLLFASCAVRSFAYGFFSVILGLYLDILGMSADVIGWIFTAALAGGAVMTTLITSVADRFGRRCLPECCLHASPGVYLFCSPAA
jgi:MFS family permease